MLINLLLLPLFAAFAFGNVCSDVFKRIAVEPEYSQVRPLVFSSTEVFRRNNNIGIQQLGELRLEKWIELKPYSDKAYNFIGLTKSGRIYQVVDWNGQRSVARLLSGDKVFEDVFLLNQKKLGAIDYEGRVHFYSPIIWARSPLKSILKRGALLWSGVTLIGSVSLHQMTGELWSKAESNLLMLAPTVFVGLISGLQTALVMTSRYDHLNTHPDGFFSTQIQVTGFADLNRVLRAMDSHEVINKISGYDFDLPNLQSLNPKLAEDWSEPIH